MITNIECWPDTSKKHHNTGYKNEHTRTDSSYHYSLWKESLNRDGYQFLQYKQSEQAPLILSEITEHIDTTTSDVRNSGPGLGQAQTCGRVKPVNGIPTLSKTYMIIDTSNKFNII